MSLASRTIARIFREHFTDTSSFVKTKEEQPECIAKIKKRLGEMDDVKSDSMTYHNHKQEVCEYRFTITRENAWGSGATFVVKFDQNDHLIIDNYGQNTPVGNMDLIYSFVEAIKLEHEKQQAKETKRAKIKKLKNQAIIAKLKEIAKEDRFDFRTREYNIKLKLYIRIAPGTVAEVDIPYSKFHNIMQNLRALIQTMRTLYASGITFRLKTRGRYEGNYDWISYESL